jgi:hypothetical protein
MFYRPSLDVKKRKEEKKRRKEKKKRRKEPPSFSPLLNCKVHAQIEHGRKGPQLTNQKRRK